MNTRQTIPSLAAALAIAVTTGCGGEDHDHMQVSFAAKGHSLVATATGDWQLPDLRFTLVHHHDGQTRVTHSVEVALLRGAAGADLERFRASLGAEFVEYLLKAIPASMDRADERDVRFKQLLRGILAGELPLSDEIGSRSSALFVKPPALSGPLQVAPKRRPCDDCWLLLMACLTCEPEMQCWNDYQICLDWCY